MKVDIGYGMTEEELKKAVKECPGGRNAFLICRKCGEYWSKPWGCSDSAMITSECGKCNK